MQKYSKNKQHSVTNTQKTTLLGGFFAFFYNQ